MNLKNVARRIRDEFLAWLKYGPFFRLKEKKLSSHSLITALYPVILSEKKSDKLCLMAHFDPQGRIEPYVLYYVKALAEEGFDVVLISTSAVLDDSDVKNALKYCRGIIVRKNIGLDFASWKTAFDFIPDVWKYDRILLANDSVFGPFTSLKEVLKKFEESSAQVCGLTDCHQIDYHLQSYFLFFKKEIFNNPTFVNFWENMRIKHVKMEIVREYEVGFSSKLLSAGVELFALYKYDEILKYVKASIPDFQYISDLEKHPLNSSLHMWDILLGKYNYPFIKTEILKTNRFNSSLVANWKTLVPESGRDLVPIIENYLEKFATDSTDRN